MTDPVLSLAFSVYSAKGVYALLLGSGISRSAGVPTGWDVTQDLIRRAARLYGEDGSNTEEWFKAKYDKDPDYSELLEQLAKSPAERTKLLQAYFEPTEQERSEGQKLPTVAHRAIATLVAKGYIRVIITTNFDRLLEQALGDVGVQPSVIASADSEKGALPLAHARCTVIKINGDYLDPRFKNTRDELSSYEPALDRLLDRVIDEYGLIVRGWSAEWDTALRTAIERCPTRRFTTYWAAHRKCSEKALRVIDNRQGVILLIADADALFSELADRVDALETFSANDPLSAPIAVARAKRYLSDIPNARSCCTICSSTRQSRCSKERIFSTSRRTMRIRHRQHYCLD
jgi:SIR2-like domain